MGTTGGTPYWGIGVLGVFVSSGGVCDPSPTHFLSPALCIGPCPKKAEGGAPLCVPSLVAGADAGRCVTGATRRVGTKMGLSLAWVFAY